MDETQEDLIELAEDDWRRGVKVGSEVYWEDPDEGISSGYYRVANIHTESGEIESDDSILMLHSEAGSECEVYASELQASAPAPKMRCK